MNISWPTLAMSQTSLSESRTFIPPAVTTPTKKKTPNCPQQETHVAVHLLVFDEGLGPDLQDVRDALIPELCCKGFDLAAMPWVADQVPLFLGSKQVTIFRKSKCDPPTV